MQGVLDFSSVLGERVFEPREITYEFKLPFTEYEGRKVAERRIKSQMVTKTERNYSILTIGVIIGWARLRALKLRTTQSERIWLLQSSSNAIRSHSMRTNTSMMFGTRLI